MSKSSPSTSTTNVVNPVSQAQLPYLQDLWGKSQGMVGPTYTQGVGGNYLENLNAAATNNYNYATGSPNYYSMFPNATGAVSSMLGGTFGQGGYAAGPQIGGLDTSATNAVDWATNYGRQISDAAAQAPGIGAAWGNALGQVGGAGADLLTPGYGSYNTLTGLGGNAVGALTGLGGNAVGAIGGYAPAAIQAGIPAEQQLNANAGMAISGNPVYSSGLMGLASGAYIDPRMNPALPGVIKSATDPLVNQYMTATAPGTTSAAEQAGRYGSGVMGNQQNLNEYNLGQALQSTISNVVNNAYNTGIGATESAGSALGNIFNTGIGNVTSALSALGGLAQGGVQNAANITNQGYQTGGNLVGQGYSTGGNLISGGAGALSSLAGTGLGAANTAYNNAGNLGLAGLSADIQGLTNAGNLTNTGWQNAGNMLSSAGQLANTGQLDLSTLAQLTPDLANFPLSQMSTAFNSTWAPLQNYSSILGSPQAQSQQTQQTTPYYTNIGSSLASGLSGLSALKTLGAFSLFG